jgi:hypothetical protein
MVTLCRELGIRHPEELSFCKPLGMCFTIEIENTLFIRFTCKLKKSVSDPKISHESD